MSGPEVVAEARRWIGTPYRHQAATRGAGCDCLGLIRGVWAALLGDLPERVPAYSSDWAEPQRQEVLLQAALRHLVPRPLTEAEPGDVLLFRMRAGAVAKHLAFQGEVGAHPTFIHSYSGHGVVENPLTRPWARRIVARFHFPERGA
ncbi:peptidase [Loktanella sp. IMCC34160]|uniref:NlpC/P60 family protein n=1 Tax=Loktanella sp. IMCC34160 TaxID=2510646 RepID=UPI00101E157C|nr:NlpC/P60 family protein [Loktanella sp. IMCC34160]RYG91931.1 peptidase [Loktanella sp. IMCC34160]